MAMRVTGTMYFTTDLDRAVDYYTQKLGYKLLSREDWGFAVFEVDGVARLGVTLASAWDPDWKEGDPLPRPRLDLRTDDIEAVHRRLKDAGADVDPLQGDPGSFRAIGLRDADGNELFIWDDGGELEG